jgi:hypothetical protein
MATGAPALAWNDHGHELIACIAYQDLKPGVREKIDALLKQHPQYEALIDKAPPGFDTNLLAFMRAATWPDMVRTQTNPFHATDHHTYWHYINIPLSFDKTDGPAPKFEWKPGSDPENAVQALAKCESDLKDPKTKDQDKARRVSWMLHVGGDLHQPLHAVALFSKAYPKGDQGGNLFWVGFDDRPVKLHAFWDSVLGETKDVKRISERATKLRKAKGLGRADFEKQLKDDTFRSWAEESAALAKSFAYQDGKLEGAKSKDKDHPPTTAPALPKGYPTNAETEAEKRAALAGYRLADRLNTILGKP